MSLNNFLSRLIWLCALPLILLASYLAYDHVRTIGAGENIEAANLVTNFATAIDHNLSMRISAIQTLALSPHADDPALWNELYLEAQGFQQAFGSNIILADTEMRAHFNTNVPFATPQPVLPRPRGHAAAPAALQSGKPEIGDIFPGPITKQPMIAIAVPGVRENRIIFLLLTAIETHQFQNRLDEVRLPADWSLTLLDGSGGVIARRAPPGLDPVANGDAGGRFVVKSAVSPWSAVLEIPRSVQRRPLLEAAAVLAIAIVCATLVAVVGGTLASRRLARSVASLTSAPAPGAPLPRITEIAAARRLLDEMAETRESAEAARRDSEEHFRATFEQAAVGIAMVAPEGHWLKVNQKMCDIVGYSHDELMAKTFRDITHPKHLGPDLRQLERLLNGEIRTYATEKRYLRKDGTVVWGNVSVSLVRHADGSPNHFIAVVEDIQRRKDAEDAQKSSEVRLNFALQNCHIGAWELDLGDHSARRTLIHDRIFGYQTLLPLWTYEMFLKHVLIEDRPDVDQRFRTATAAQTDWDFECRIRRADGEVRWIWAAGGHERISDGKPVRMSGIVQDITERKREGLRTAALLDLSTSGNTVDDRMLLQQGLNTLQRLTESCIGFIHFVSEDQNEIELVTWSTDTLAHYCHAAFDSHYPVSEAGIWADSIRLKHPIIINDYAAAPGKKGLPEGHSVLQRFISAPIFEGNLVRMIVGVGNAARDYAEHDVDTATLFGNDLYRIVKRRRAEEEVRRLNQTLEKRVAERTAELTAANKELDSFAYSVSHDLRAPLRSIDGFATVLEEDYAAVLDGDGRDALQRVRAAAQRMGALIDDLLSLSRLSRADMNMEAVDLGVLAASVADTLRQREPQRSVVFDIAPKLEVRGDRQLLMILLENLLGNAWKFTGKHAQARIEIGVTEKLGKPAYFVRDDGAGFDMLYAAKLFTPFQRLHNVSDFPGTGIGLATVRRIVNRHGGSVWAEGAVDKGATFYFTLST